MSLEDERNKFGLISKRILKTNVSKNPVTLQAYKRDIVTAHNHFVDYVRSKFETASDRNQKVYLDNLNYIRSKTKNCFQKLGVNFPFTNDPFEFVQESTLTSSTEDNQGTGSSESDETDESEEEEVENSDDNKETKGNGSNSENNRENDGSRNNQNNDNSQNNGNPNEMALTVVEFLNFATKIVPDFDGTYANLASFTDALNLANASVATHLPSYIELIKTKLKGDSRSYIGNEATVQAIIQTLQANVKPESASLIESKMMSIHQAKKKPNDYMKEIESLAANLKRAHITDGIPIAAADNLATNCAVKAIRQNASSDKVKWLMEASTFTNLNEVVDKFISLSTAETSSTSNNATINYIRRPNVGYYRGRRQNNRGYYRNNDNRRGNNSYNQNYRSNNFRGSNNRGFYRNNDNRRGNNSYNSNRRTNYVRYVNAERDDNQGNLPAPQQVMLRDA